MADVAMKKSQMRVFVGFWARAKRQRSRSLAFAMSGLETIKANERCGSGWCVAGEKVMWDERWWLVVGLAPGMDGGRVTSAAEAECNLQRLPQASMPIRLLRAAQSLRAGSAPRGARSFAGRRR
jgi:hypothetical protein